MTRRARLFPLVMTEKALWSASIRLLDMIDPGHPSYDPTKLRYHADELREVLLELRQRGTQLELVPPAN